MNVDSLRKAALTVKGQHKIAAAIYDKKGNCLSWAVNSYIKTHPIQKRYANKAGEFHKEYLHAEIRAIIGLKGRTPYKLLLVRVNRKGDLLPIHPCPICSIALKEAGIVLVEHPYV
jgi:tRNA(Arg) A34 adenosine deaminase TadA